LNAVAAASSTPPASGTRTPTSNATSSQRPALVSLAPSLAR
jgi:hypothetical protein